MRALTERAGDGMTADRVACAEPPATVPDTVSHRRQRDQRLRPLSQPDRLGRGRWGAVAPGAEGRDDSPWELQAPGARPRSQDRRVLYVRPPALPPDSIRRRHVGSRDSPGRAARARGARIVRLPEGAICFPGPSAMAVDGPDTGRSRGRGPVPVAGTPVRVGGDRRVGPRVGLWTVLASVHRLTGPHRPHDSASTWSPIAPRSSRATTSAGAVRGVREAGRRLRPDLHDRRVPGERRRPGPGPRRGQWPLGRFRGARTAQSHRTAGDHRPQWRLAWAVSRGRFVGGRGRGPRRRLRGRRQVGRLRVPGLGRRARGSTPSTRRPIRAAKTEPRPSGTRRSSRTGRIESEGFARGTASGASASGSIRPVRR